MENLHQQATTDSFNKQHQFHNYPQNPISEIEEIEEENSSELFEVSSRDPLPTIIEEESDSESMFSFDIHGSRARLVSREENCVHVVIGKSESRSTDALSWTLKNIGSNVNSNFMVYLLHIYPEVHRIPYPLGMIPKSQASPEQVKIYMAQESAKRREFLQKFIDLCSASKVKVDFVLIESDAVAKAILDLIPILNMRKLVLGTTKSGIRKLRSKKGNSCANQILRDAPSFCEVKIICEGKEVVDPMNGAPAPSEADSESAKAMLPESNDNKSPKSTQLFCFRTPRVE